MTLHPSFVWDNRRILPPLRHVPIKEAAFCIVHSWMSPRWKRPETADEVIACNRVDSEIERILLEREMKAIERRNGL